MKALTSIFSTLLALVVVLSSFSLTIDKHICMGRVQSVAILHDAAPCAMEMMAESGMGTREGCCQDTQTKIEGNDLQVKNLKPIALEYQSLWVAELPWVIEVLQPESRISFDSGIYHIPPLIEREIPILHQSFLI